MTSFANGAVLTAAQLNALAAALDAAGFYTSPNTGAVPRTTRAKHADMLSVKDFGAVGDGVTNDSAAFTAAFAAASQHQSAVSYWGTKLPTVYVPPGDYIAAFDIPHGGSLECAGQEAVTIITPPGANRSAIRCLIATTPVPIWYSAFVRQNISGCTVDGNASAQTAGHGIEWVDAPYPLSTEYGCSGTLTDVRVIGTKGHNIYLGVNRNWPLFTRVIANYAGTGFDSLRLLCYDGRFSDCDFGQSDYGINLQAGGGNTFTGCNIYGNRHCAVAKSGYHGAYLFFAGCTFDASQEQTIYLQASYSGAITELVGFANCSFRVVSAAGDGLWPVFDLVDGVRVSITGGGVIRGGATENRASYVFRSSGTAVADLHLEGFAIERSAANFVPFSIAVFSDPTMLAPIDGPVSIRASASSPTAARIGVAADAAASTFFEIRCKDSGYVRVGSERGFALIVQALDTVTANAVKLAGTATGSPPIITCEGDTNLDLRFQPRGTGRLRLQDNGSVDRIAVDQAKGVAFQPLGSATPTINGELVVQITSNTSLTFKLKGSDGTVRTASLTLT